MSAPVETGVHEEPPSPRDRVAPDVGERTRPWRLLLAGCLALATLSLLLPSVPTYDPWAWIIWGREVLHGDLVTATGPSWKPLPVMITTPFSMLGDTSAPLAWLAVARAGGILAIAMAYRLGARLSGRAAGAIAAVALILSDDFVFNFVRGNSEGILVAVSLWAIERHLEGRRVNAFLFGCTAGLLRPEVWPFLGLYGLYLLWIDRGWRVRTLVVGGGALLVMLWFLPEYWGSGDLLRAAARARQPTPDSPAFAVHPFFSVLSRSASVLSPPVLFGGVLAVFAAIRLRDRLMLVLAVAATVMTFAVAAMTQAGFAGNPRYVTLPAAIMCVLSGAGWVRLADSVQVRRGAAALAALMTAGITLAYPSVRDDIKEVLNEADTVKEEAEIFGSVPEAIAAAGGAARLTGCGPIYTGAFETQTVAWYMHLHQTQVEIAATPPGTTIALKSDPLSHDSRFPTITRTEHWVVGSSCHSSVRLGPGGAVVSTAPTALDRTTDLHGRKPLPGGQGILE